MSKPRLRVFATSTRWLCHRVLPTGAAVLAFCLSGCALEHGSRTARSSDAGTNGSEDAGGGSSGRGSSPGGSGGACAPVLQSRDLLVFDDNGPTALLPHAPPNTTHVLNGRVSEQGKGLPAHLKGLPDFKPERVDEYRYLRIRGDTRSWTIALRGVKGFGIKDRSPVFAELEVEVGELEPTHIKLTLHAVDRLTFYYELGTSFASLEPPLDLSIARGRVACTQSDACGEWLSHTLRVHDNSYAGDAELWPFEEKEVGPFRVAHAGSIEQSPSENADCDKASLNRTQVVAYLSEPVFNPHGCPRHMVSTAPLPGANFGFRDGMPCRFNLKQAALGIAVAYELKVTEPIAILTRQPVAHGMCTLTGDLPPDIVASEQVSGNGQTFQPPASNDCDPQRLEPVILEPGRYTHIFRWDTVNWKGRGAEPFAPGTYRLGIATFGQYALTPDAPLKGYGYGADMEIELVR